MSDGWTAVTRDRSLSAQFEHSVAVTETGVEVFHQVAGGARQSLSRACRRMKKAADAAKAKQACATPRRIITVIGGVCATAFIEAGETALADYEMLELLLFRAIARRDVKPQPRP
ncbi:MAG: hypothetical protein U1E25_12370 [Methylocystis sp.]